MKGKCLCGEVGVEVDAAPDFINICNCKLCRKSGAAWGYYSPAAINVAGTTSTYRRDDLGHEPWCEAHFCATCGSTTHFDVVHPDHDGVGVNMRLFAQDELEGIEVHYYDTRSRQQPTDPVEKTGEGRIGDGKAF